ncbi:high mobility group box domain-containing protein, partial [Sparassis latifolia]
MSSAKSSGTRSRKATDKEKIKIPQGRRIRHRSSPSVLNITHFFRSAVPFTFNTKDINVGDDRASLASSPSTVATTRLATYSGRKDEDHIPRPKNAFILFRGSCWKVEKERVDKPGTSSNFSKIAAQVWKSMSAEQQDPWRRLAEEEKHLHNLHYPGYKY